MPKIILDGAVAEDNWQILNEDAPTSLEEIGEGQFLLPLASWNAMQAESKQIPENLGLLLESTDTPEDIQGDIPSIPVIAVNFPAFADGRGFSIGTLLRQRYAFTGQLRAVGKPIRDQLSYLVRCGFNAIQLAEHYDPEKSLESLKDFSDAYQTAVDQSTPLFRRRG